MDSSAPASDGRRTEFRLLKPMPSRQDPAVPEGAMLREQPWDTQIRRLFPARETPAAKLPGVQGIQLGHFEIDERIARGGMGTVFLARDLRLDRVVALKVLSQEQLSDPAAVQRFQNEARSAARLDHENIARVYYVGEDRGVHYIAFEYVRGTTVRETIANQGRLSLDDAVNYTLQAADALRHLDSAGVVHRDIKPSNLIVTPSGRVKLVDLGLARQTAPSEAEDLTVTGTTLGTFDYISPEQARDPRNVDIRSDIYSLGCTLYQMLTGSPPYPQGSSVDKLLQHSAGRPPDPVELNPRVSPRLSLIVQRMMASNPDERFPSPQALIDELSDLADSLGLRASAPEGTIWRQPLYRESPPWWDRQRGWMIAAGVIALLAFFGDEASHRLNWRRSLDPDAVTQTQPAQVAPTARDSARPLPLTAASTQPPASVTTSATKNEPPVAASGTPSVADTPSVTIPVGSQEKVLPPPADLPLDASVPPATRVTVSELAAAVLSSSLLPVTTDMAPSNSPAGTTPAQGSAGVAAPQVSAAPVAEPPFLLIDAEGAATGRFQTLEAACHVAKSGAVIEIHHDGLLPAAQKPVLIQGKRLTIRPAAGVRPVLRLAPGENPPGLTSARMIEVVNGSLELYDVDLQMEVTSSQAAEEWVLLSLMRVREVILQRVTLTAVNAGWRPATLIERRMPADAPTLMMPAAEPLREAEIQCRDCLFRGNAVCFSDRTLEPAVVRMSDSAIHVDGDVLNVRGGDRADMDGASRVSAVVRVEFDHVTAIGGQSLLRVMTDAVRDLPEVRIDCRNSILQAATGASPWMLLEGHQDSDILLQRVRWSGSRNVLVLNMAAACVVRGLYPRGGDDWTYSLSQWQVQWQPDWELDSETVTDRNPLAWDAAAGEPTSTAQLSDFALRPMGVDEPANPALGTASDTSDRGFRPSLSSLPPQLPTGSGV